MDFLFPEMSCATLPSALPASSYSAVPLGEIFGAAHFLEAADGPLEFEASVATRIKAFRLGVRRGQKLDLMLVKRVDQGNEPRRLVAHIAAHHRNADDDDRVVAPGDREIIGCAARFSA